MARTTWNSDEDRLHSPSRRRYRKLFGDFPYSPARDPLVVLASLRTPARTAQHQYGYLPLRAAAMRPVTLPGGAA